MRMFLFVSLFLPVLAHAQDELLRAEQGQPKSVVALMDRYAGCNHWLGEEPTDPERARDINKAVTELRCAQLPQDAAKLKKRFSGNPKVLEAIDAAKDLAE